MLVPRSVLTAPARRLPTLLSALLLTLAAGCSVTRLAPETDTPMPSEVLRETEASGCLAVLLPGRWDRMNAFRKAGFPERAEATGLNVGLVTADAHIGYYREEILVPRLRQDVIGPARAGGAERIWLVGTSLGAVGSLIYWTRHPDEIAGLVLIAPYLGEDREAEDGVLDEIRRAGNLQDWSPPGPVADDDFERRIWLTLRDLTAPGSTTPVFLAYGTDDDLAPGHRLLARELPETRVVSRDGGHDWKTWARLWSDVLDSGAICDEP